MVSKFAIQEALWTKKMAGNILKLCIAIDTLKKRGLTTAPLEHIMKTD